MFGRGLLQVRPSNLDMDRTRGHRKVLYDVAYKWAPLGPVILLFIICATLLSVWGQLSPPVVIAFCTTAGILVAFFVLSHLILYFTRIKDDVDLEKNRGSSSSGSSTSDDRQEVSQIGPKYRGLDFPQPFS